MNKSTNLAAKRISIPQGAPLLNKSNEQLVPRGSAEFRDPSQPDLLSMVPQSARSIKSSSARSGSSGVSGKIEIEREEERQIILIDMDAYYAQVEIKKHNIDPTKPVAVQQWNGVIALNYVAKARGVTRSMTVYDALAHCSDLILVHVSTFEIRDEDLFPQGGQQQKTFVPKPQKHFGSEIVDHEAEQEAALGLQRTADKGGFQVPQPRPLPSRGSGQARTSDELVTQQEDSDSDCEDGHRVIDSSICRTKMISKDESLEPYRRFWVEMRQKQNQKVSLKLYRTESRKILRVLQRFSDQVEKASCDEAFLDVTAQVKLMYRNTKEGEYEGTSDAWCNALFMGFE